MFTIKVTKEGGYTAYCGEIYEVERESNGGVKLHITPKPHAETFTVNVWPVQGFKKMIFIENSNGKTIDTIRLPKLYLAATPSSKEAEYVQIVE